MAAGAAAAAARDVSLQNTPTWAVATVFFLLIALSLLLVHCIHLLGKWLHGHRKNALVDAVERLKGELMILGFISMLLAVSQNSVSRICVPTKFADTMLPCRRAASTLAAPPISLGGGHHKRLLWVNSRNPPEDGYSSWKPMRMLSGGGDPDTKADFCGARGKVSLVSQAGLHQLHIFIFVLAVVHVLYSVVTMALGRAKMRSWKAWEKETQSLEYQIAHDSRRFRYTRETSFARRHVNFWTESSFLRLWIAHFSNFKSFNFQKYIQRSLENDFKTVLRISPAMWLLVVLFMAINVYRWYSYFWMSFLPLVAVLAVGTKLHHIVAKMALQLDQNTVVISGAPLVRPSDQLFWFGNPKFILSVLHLIPFQMGSEFKWATYEEQTASVLRRWHEDVRNKRMLQQHSSADSTSTSVSGGNTILTPAKS
ncbi:hypothetical protein Taro_015069 [Colocasia esculenta]|uniref:MLO-like protein n=1 Tax=Colocasia esculenta TaxID=4460 RepID=A0A843US54_COLES|nr:hypothetical protein [Colocasia esculenta]